MSNTAKKFFVAALCGALVAAAWATGLLDLLGAPERVRDLLREGGHASWAVFLLAFTILSAVGVPSVVFLVPMPLVWPMPVSLALGIVGSMTSSVLGFWIARYVARDWVANHLPARLQRFDERLANNGLRTVVIIRMIFFLTPPSTWFLALSRIPLSTYVVGTLVGGLPGIIFFVVVGGSFFG
ncbi:MAG: TVP38/TMEM64 family protein, partial [Polyangiaceae bacterium]|nr:TVP38/TMEM64 family protein [Polyangiaceae bacterium]